VVDNVILGIKTQPEKIVLSIVRALAELIVMGLANLLQPEKAEAPILPMLVEGIVKVVKLLQF
jgi:hypothetical protein